MKRRVWFSTVSGLVVILLSVGWSWGKKDGKSEEAQPTVTANTGASVASSEVKPDAAQEEKIVHTFATDDEVKAFASLWQQRQGIITRMAVLRAYWSEEQARLNEMDTQLTSTYKLDLKKRHVLSQERKALIELEPLPESTDAPAKDSPASEPDSD